MSEGSDKLANFLREVSSWRWNEFVEAEHNLEYTTNQSIIFALLRACSMEKMDAIKVALNRLDGKLKTPIKIETPKVFYLYPNVETIGEGDGTLVPSDNPNTVNELVSGEIVTTTTTTTVTEKDLPSMGMRETLAEMSDYTRELPQQIVDYAVQTEQWMKHHGERPEEIPMVKSVIAAHLLIMAQKRDLAAINEVFDSIDGKLVETFQVLGEDMFLVNFGKLAPPGGTRNADGIYMIEATAVQDMWATKLTEGK